MMYKPVLCSLLFMSMVCAAANGENFRAMDFQFDPQMDNYATAVLADQDTGEEWVIARGDQVNDWRVAEVTAEYIGLVQYPDDEPYPLLNRIYYRLKAFDDALDENP